MTPPTSAGTNNNSNKKNGNANNNISNNHNNEMMDRAWMEQIQSKEIQRVREDLIQKFLSHGVSMDVAEREVDSFLYDKKRSQSFVNMRQYAASKKEDDDILEGSALVPGIAFVMVTILASVLMDSFMK